MPAASRNEKLFTQHIQVQKLCSLQLGTTCEANDNFTIPFAGTFRLLAFLERALGGRRRLQFLVSLYMGCPSPAPETSSLHKLLLNNSLFIPLTQAFTWKGPIHAHKESLGGKKVEAAPHAWNIYDPWLPTLYEIKGRHFMWLGAVREPRKGRKIISWRLVQLGFIKYTSRPLFGVL